jgi:hypothetical protein
MKKLFGLLLLTAFALAAGELDGKWSGKFDITHSDGDTKVTGTAGPDETKQWTIKNGKLEEGKLTFQVDTEGGGSIAFELVFDGDTIRGSATGTGDGGEKMSAKVDLKRVS